MIITREVDRVEFNSIQSSVILTFDYTAVDDRFPKRLRCGDGDRRFGVVRRNPSTRGSHLEHTVCAEADKRGDAGRKRAIRQRARERGSRRL